MPILEPVLCNRENERQFVAGVNTKLFVTCLFPHGKLQSTSQEKVDNFTPYWNCCTLSIILSTSHVMAVGSPIAGFVISNDLSLTLYMPNILFTLTLLRLSQEIGTNVVVLLAGLVQLRQNLKFHLGGGPGPSYICDISTYWRVQRKG